MRGVWGFFPKVGALVLVFGGTVRAVDNFRCYDCFQTVVVDAGLDSRVKAYVEPIKATKAALRKHGRDAKTIRGICDMWSKLSRTGKISQIYPGYYGESLVDGPKSDIFTTCAGVANRMSEIAEEEKQTNDPHSVSDAIRSIEMIEIVRFGSYDALFTSAAYMRRPMKVLQANLKTLSKPDRIRLIAIQDQSKREARIRLLGQIVNHLKVQYQARYGKEMTQLDDPSYASYVKRDGHHVAAEHFFGFDREIGFQAALKK